jgi:TonB family protein
MYFDFEDRHDRYQPLGSRSQRWTIFLGPVAVYSLVFVILLLLPSLPVFAVSTPTDAPVPPPKPREERTFVFVQPRLDVEAPKPPERGEFSDKDRIARNELKSRRPENPMPAARGNSRERVEAMPDLRARGEGPRPEPTLEPAAPDIVERLPVPPSSEREEVPMPTARPRPPQGGSLGEALRNLQKYVDRESFNNDQGQAQNLGPLQFDTKGVEFGPWIRRFVAQVRRNWFVPMAAMSLRGRVVLTFFVHRNGALTDVQIIQPSSVESFNISARNALLASNPTEPLPPEYPDDRVFFTVTFYYNENPY